MVCLVRVELRSGRILAMDKTGVRVCRTRMVLGSRIGTRAGQECGAGHEGWVRAQHLGSTFKGAEAFCIWPEFAVFWGYGSV